MTKANTYKLRQYNNSTASSLYDVYGSFSSKKYNAWKYCESLKARHNGHDLRVLSANTYMFTAGFRFRDDNGNDCLMYITPSKDEIITIA